MATFARPQRALVSGASGFIGSRLCARLCALGFEVHGISRREVSPVQDGIHWHRANLADFDSARAVVRAVRPDLFFHLASHVSGSRDLAALMPTFRDNLASTVHVLTALAETGCSRCVLAGSLEEPDFGRGQIVPGSPYAAAKGATSLYAGLFHELYGLPVAMARIFMVYGPGQRDTAKLVPYAIRSFLRGEQPSFSSGVRLVDWVYVDDVVEGLIALVRDPRAEGRTVDLGSGELYTVRDVVLEIANLIGVEDSITFGCLPDRPMEQVRRANLADTEATIGWRPRIGLSEGLGRTVAAYRRLLEHEAGRAARERARSYQLGAQ